MKVALGLKRRLSRKVGRSALWPESRTPQGGLWVPWKKWPEKSGGDLEEVTVKNIPFGEECPAVVGMLSSCVFLSLLAPIVACSSHACMKI